MISPDLTTQIILRGPFSLKASSGFSESQEIFGFLGGTEIYKISDKKDRGWKTYGWQIGWHSGFGFDWP